MDDRTAYDCLKRRDPAGLETLMYAYGALVVYIVRQILGSDPAGDNEECATDVWISVWQKASQYDAAKSSGKGAYGFKGMEISLENGRWVVTKPGLAVKS